MMQQTMPAKKVTVIPPLPELQPENRAKYRQLRVAAYCRVSTKQEEQENSYETQKAYYTEKIQKNPEWEFVGIFADKGLTGTSAEKRPEFMKMIRKCKQGKIDRILIKSVSRFSRNIVDCLHYIRLLAALDIGITFEKENIDTLDMGSETYLSIYSIFSQSESESISGNVTWGKQRSFMNGKVPMNYGSMLGYQRGADGEPEIVEEEAETVRRIYREFLIGRSLRQIKTGLEEDQIPTPKGNSIWRIETIHNMLQNERYRGDALLQKTYVPNVLAKRSKKNHGERPQYYVSNNHPAIVDGATFDRVQEEPKDVEQRKDRTGEIQQQVRPDRTAGLRPVWLSLPANHLGAQWYQENRLAVREPPREREEILSGFPHAGGGYAADRDRTGAEPDATLPRLRHRSAAEQRWPRPAWWRFGRNLHHSSADTGAAEPADGAGTQMRGERRCGAL